MTAQGNADLVRSGYEAFSKGDLETVSKLFASEIRWHIPGRSPIAGTYTGHDEVFGFFATLVQETGGTFKVDVHDLLASDDHVVVLAKESAERAGRSLDSNEVHVWHIEDGLATEFWGCPVDAYAADEFWT